MSRPMRREETGSKQTWTALVARLKFDHLFQTTFVTSLNSNASLRLRALKRSLSFTDSRFCFCYSSWSKTSKSRFDPTAPLHRTVTVVAESGPCRSFFCLEVLRFGLLAAGHVDLSLRLAAAFRRLIYKRRMGPFGESGVGEMSGRWLALMPVCRLRMSV